MAKELIAPTIAGPFAPALFSYDPLDSKFRPQLPEKHPAFLFDLINVRPKTFQTNNAQFETPKNGTRMGPISLRFTIPPLTRTGGTYARLPNWAGIRLVKSLEIRYGNNRLGNVLDGESLLMLVKKNLKQDDLDLIAGPAGANLSQGQREARALNAQTFTFPLPLPWCDDIRKWIPVETLSNGLDIDIQFRNVRELVKSDAVDVSASVDNPILITLMSNDVIQVAEDIRKITESDQGMTIPFTDVQTTTDTIPTNSVYYKDFSLRTIRGYVESFWVDVKPLASSLPLNYEPDDRADIATVQVNANNSDLIKEIDTPFVCSELWRYFFPGPIEPGVFAWSFSLNPTETYHSFGAQYFGGMRDPYMYLRFDAGELAVNGNYEVKMYAFVKNRLQIRKNTMVTLLI